MDLWQEGKGQVRQMKDKQVVWDTGEASLVLLKKDGRIGLLWKGSPIYELDLGQLCWYSTESPWRLEGRQWQGRRVEQEMEGNRGLCLEMEHGPVRVRMHLEKPDDLPDGYPVLKLTLCFVNREDTRFGLLPEGCLCRSAGKRSRR